MELNCQIHTYETPVLRIKVMSSSGQRVQEESNSGSTDRASQLSYRLKHCGVYTIYVLIDFWKISSLNNIVTCKPVGK